MDALPAEEITLVLASLAASGLLGFGVLEAVWPTRSRRARAGQRPAPARPAPPGPPARLPIPPSLPPALSDRLDRPERALEVGQALLRRVRQDPTLDAGRRRQLLRSALGWLSWGAAAAPDDPRLAAALAEGQGALWAACHDVAVGRLGAEVPWVALGPARPPGRPPAG